jgi:mRNA interferase HigB
MRIIARKNLEAYGAKNPRALAALHRWLAVAKAAEWRTTAEVVATFSKAKVITKDRVRFEIAGGD